MAIWLSMTQLSTLSEETAHPIVYETVPLGHRGTEIVPLRVPYYGQPNSAPRGTVSVPILF